MCIRDREGRYPNDLWTPHHEYPRHKPELLPSPIPITGDGILSPITLQVGPPTSNTLLPTCHNDKQWYLRTPNFLWPKWNTKWWWRVTTRPYWYSQLTTASYSRKECATKGS
eukprot:TRINITY_DN39213_c0_g1_i1.p3 TRINITY_DN39213_c0_g1~~TRINITY_DN39213_c0_g1_i1.p3  ORF type:complete len:112 (-),score=6.32 TRINITY_DN39213_c0_g1_i1:890-1225(-)